MTSISLRSDLPLSESARHFYWPKGEGVSVWGDIADTLTDAGIEFDRWQAELSAAALALDDDGFYRSTVGGVTISIPRQAGKTFTIGGLVVALAITFPRFEAAWTSHHATTTTNTFQSMQGLVRHPGLRSKLAPNGIRKANGQEQITFRNGSRIRFGAREYGFGRGLDKIDLLVLDEAQILSLKALEDMVPTTNQAQHPHGALSFYMGTPPRPIDPGDGFMEKRRYALEENDDGFLEDSMYVEFSADSGADPEDREQWAVANPSFPKRTPVASMKRMQRNIPDMASWCREALGIWDEVVSDREAPVFDLMLWKAAEIKDHEVPADGKTVYGVKFSVDGGVAAIAGAVKPDAGPVHVEGIDEGDPRVPTVVPGLVGWLADRDGLIVVDGKGHADAFVKALLDAGVSRRRIWQMTFSEVIAAASGMQQAILAGQISHIEDEALALDDVVRRPIGKQGGWGLGGRDGSDVTLIEAVMLAHWGAVSDRRGAGAGRVVRGRRVSTGRPKAEVR